MKVAAEPPRVAPPGTQRLDARDELAGTLAQLGALDATAPLRPGDLADLLAQAVHQLLGATAVVLRPALVIGDWIMRTAGPRGEFARDTIPQLAAATPNWFTFNPACPKVHERNTVSVIERDGVHAAAAIVFDRVERNAGQTRILVCDGPLLLAWVGIVRAPERDHGRDAHVLQQLANAVRPRLRLSLAVPDPLTHPSFEASLDAFPGEAYVVRGDGHLEFANPLGAALLARTACATASQLREAVRRYPDSSHDFDLRPLRVSPTSRYFLVTRRRAEPALDARLREATRRWSLTPRQGEVLARLALGDANKDIAARLGMSVRTVEQHVATLLAVAKADSRLRLVARVWSGE